MPAPRRDRQCHWHEFPFLAQRRRGVLAIAHRGGAGEYPGNSMEAFEAAVDAGFRFFEIDLRASESGELVVWHGKRLERIRPDRLVDLEQLQSQLPAEGQTEVVFFKDVLARLPADVRFFVDLKNNQAGSALAQLLAATNEVDRICVGSFSHRRTIAAAEAIERTTGVLPCTALTPRGAIELLYLSSRRAKTRSWLAPAPSAQLPTRLATSEVIARAHSGGALVFVWTVNDSVTMNRVLDLGVDGLMTDYPTVLRRVLIERCEWNDAVTARPDLQS
jgi:glycerophosphoryl diester phosphodiesterase